MYKGLWHRFANFAGKIIAFADMEISEELKSNGRQSNGEKPGGGKSNGVQSSESRHPSGLSWDYFTNLQRKLENPPEMRLYDSFCMWSDLLGFGTQFYESGWNPSRKDWEEIRRRLLAAHSIAYLNSSMMERLLLLNDGMAKVFPFRSSDIKNYMMQLSIFFREVVIMHQQIKDKEREFGYPGARTVVAFGKGAAYIDPEIRMDDYYANYTKPDPKGLSSSAAKQGNPMIAFTPGELQMNTAFSKAYIIESKGSSIGVAGANIFVDQSVLDVLMVLAKKGNYSPIVRNGEDHIEIIIPREGEPENDVVIGFRFDLPIEPDHPEMLRWKTKIYRMQRFYPWDEKADEFWFDLDNEQGWGGIE